MKKVLATISQACIFPERLSFEVGLRNIGDEPILLGDMNFSFVCEGLHIGSARIVQQNNMLFSQQQYLPPTTTLIQVPEKDQWLIQVGISKDRETESEAFKRNLDAHYLHPYKSEQTIIFGMAISFPQGLHGGLMWDVVNSEIQEERDPIRIENIYRGALQFNLYGNTKVFLPNQNMTDDAKTETLL